FSLTNRASAAEPPPRSPIEQSTSASGGGHSLSRAARKNRPLACPVRGPMPLRCRHGPRLITLPAVPLGRLVWTDRGRLGVRGDARLDRVVLPDRLRRGLAVGRRVCARLVRGRRVFRPRAAGGGLEARRTV